MPRKLIPLTDDITNSESFSTLKTWQKNENFLGECEQKTSGEKVKEMVSKWNRTKETKVDDENLDIFSTSKKGPKDLATNKPGEKPQEKVENVELDSLKTPKSRKTIEEQKKLAHEREKKAVADYNSWEALESDNIAIYDDDKNLSLQSLQIDDKLKPRAASRSVSFLLPNLPTAKMLKLAQPETGIIINETEESVAKHKHNQLNFDPREKQQEFDGNRIKVYQCGEKLFAKLDGNCEIENADIMKGMMQKNCNRHINLKNSKLNIFEPRKKQKSVMEMTLGKPYGIQLGSLHIGNDYFPEDLRNKQALDVLLVAHGMTYIKPSVHWTQQDIDNILMIGTELYKETNEIEIDKLSQLTKGFTYKNSFIQVTMSEPVVVGKVMTLTDRSMDLQTGLQKFFSQHKHGILQTPNIELYIVYKKAIYVFDPRGRTMDCERSSQGEAALMAFTRFDNVYHLLMNLSNINIKGPFKICAVAVTQMTDSKNSTEKFSAASGNPSRKCRSDDYKFMSRQVAYLQGSIHLGSKVFGSCGGKQHLTTAVMAAVYAKIDPPNSWSSAILDHVLHFGTKLYTNCLEDEPVKNITLADIPSKFYVGDVYRVAITIAPFLKRVVIKKTRLFCDNLMTKALKSIFDNSSFRCLLLQIDNYTYSIWQMMSTEVFYFFDGFQKDVDGNIDRYEGTSFLFMTGNVDKLCEIVVNRLLATPRSEESTLNIHGMKIVELKKLSKKEQKCKPRLRMIKMDCIKPMSGDDAEKFEDSPSTVDSVAPILTAKELLKLREKPVEKPEHRQITDLNSPSLVCCKVKLYDDIMSTVDEKNSVIEPSDYQGDVFEVVRAVQSEIVRKAIDDEAAIEEPYVGNKKNCEPCENNCGNFVTCAEKVLLKTDLDCLEQEREDLMKSGGNYANTCDNLEEENQQPSPDERSHFQKLPDDSEIIRGTKKMFELPLEPKMFNYENLSVAVGVSAIITSTKYSIGSWTAEIIDYVIGCGHIMSKTIKLKNRMDFYTFEEHHLPKIHIKDKFYNLKMVAVQNGSWSRLENILKKLFESLDRFILITTRGSLAVFARKNFYYVYEYATCNMVGFRIKNNSFGSSCFLRFPDVHSMVRRIYANHPEIHDQQKFLISRVMVEELRDQDAVVDYVPFTASQERDIIEHLRQNQMMRWDQRIEKLKTMNAKIHAEKERVKKYRQKTGQMETEDTNDENLTRSNFDFNVEMNDDDFRLDTKSFERKNEDFGISEPLHEKYQEMDEIVGYQLKEDGMSKIEGSFALTDRMTCEDLKPCHFVGIFAIMYAVHHPVKTMNGRSVDVILENGIRVHDKLDIDEYQKRKILNRIVVDTTCYELMVEEYKVKNLITKRKNVQEYSKLALVELFNNQKYGLLESGNCCMVIINGSDSFHLFDPYDVNDCEAGKKQTENAAASWINFKTLDDVVHYIDQRMLSPQQNSESKIPFKMNFVKVLSYKTIKAPKAGYFLMNLPNGQSSSNQKSCQSIELAEDEKIEWIYSTKTVPWSRLETKNAMGIERYLTASKWKEFDVEMDNKLYSLWGNIHPNMKIFKNHAGKQYLTCAVVSLVIARMYNIDEWDAILLDSIIAHGHKYYLETIKRVDKNKYNLKVEDLSSNCCINNFKFNVDVRPIINGKLYDDDKLNFNLNRALDYVFRSKNLSGVILQCGGKFLAIGNVNNRDYFMFDSQAHGLPLFGANQGTSYVLKCCCLKVLLACIVLTLNIKCHNVKFHLYAVNTKFSDEVCIENDEKEKKENDKIVLTASKSKTVVFAKTSTDGNSPKISSPDDSFYSIMSN